MNEDFARSLERYLFMLGIAPLDDAVVFGSAVMKLHGLKDDIGDVDLFVPPRVYARLRRWPPWQEQRPLPSDPPFLRAALDDGGLTVCAFHAWTSRDPWLDIPEAVASARRVCGVLCVRLELVASWKYQALVWCAENDVAVEGSPWEKHVDDLFVLQEAGVHVPELMQQ